MTNVATQLDPRLLASLEALADEWRDEAAEHAVDRKYGPNPRRAWYLEHMADRVIPIARKPKRLRR